MTAETVAATVSPLMTAFTDDRGREIEVGHEVAVLYINPDRGAAQWMNRGTVVGFGRTRVRVKFTIDRLPYRAIGPECLRVTTDIQPMTLVEALAGLSSPVERPADRGHPTTEENP